MLNFAEKAKFTLATMGGRLAPGLLVAIVTLLLACSAAQAQSTPVISPSTGSFATEQTVSITASSGSVFYTLDGTQPSNLSTPYTGTFVVDNPTQVRAVSYLSPNYSALATSYLDVDPSLTPILQTGLILRLHAGFGVESSGSPTYVSRWVDLSGQGNDATGTSGSQPTFVNSGSNFLPGVKFNGASQFLSLPSLSTSFSGLTMFVVVQPTSIASNARILDFGQASSGNDVLMQFSSSGSNGQFWTFAGTSGTSASSPSSLSANNAVLLEAVQSGDSATFYVNGSPGTSNSSMNAIPSVTYSSNFLAQASSGGNFFPGLISEVLLFSTNLTDSQRAAIEAVLAQKYQVFSVVPATPIIGVPSGTLPAPAQVVISTRPDTITFYTTDGTDPTTSSQIYSGNPIPVTYSETIKAMSFRGGVQSSVASATYTLDSGIYPAPSATDMTPPAINLQLPAPGI